MSARPSPAELGLLEKARELARRGEGAVSPNPPVGAVIVRGGEIVGQGWHRGPGRPHAEAAALADAGAAARGATMVCTLEPCTHHGRTPPCSDALIAAGVLRVVIGARDPLERGDARRGGAELLRAAGITVVEAEGDDAERCRELAGAFLTHALTTRPLVTLKLATSLDGRIATAAGESRWITGEPARQLVHRWRAASDAVAIGAGTAMADDPALTARDVDGEVRQPRAVVFDDRAELPLDGVLVREGAERGLIVVVDERADPARQTALANAGADVRAISGTRAERIAGALDLMGELGIQSLFVEGGAGLAGALVAADLVDRLRWFLAPILIGGRAAPGAVGEPGIAGLADAPRLGRAESAWIGDDLLVSGCLRPAAWEV